MHEVLLSSISFQVILNLYGSESGREINTQKLEILFSVNTPIAIKRTIGSTFGIYRSSQSIRYLGTTLSLQMSLSSHKRWGKKKLAGGGKQVSCLIQSSCTVKTHSILLHCQHPIRSDPCHMRERYFHLLHTQKPLSIVSACRLLMHSICFPR